MKRRDVMMAIPMALLVGPAAAQYMGPEVTGTSATVADATNARLGSYVTITGNIVSHLRGDFYQFSDETGEMRVEIDRLVFRNQPVMPETMVRLHGEIDRDTRGRYMWVNALDVVS